MTKAAIDALLVFVVAACWLGCLGFVRLRTALDRLHCVAFVNATAGLGMAAAAFVSDGASGRAIKILMIAAIGLLAGAATSHATARALLLRGSAPEVDAGASRQ